MLPFLETHTQQLGLLSTGHSRVHGPSEIPKAWTRIPPRTWDSFEGHPSGEKSDGLTVGDGSRFNSGPGKAQSGASVMGG